VIFRVTDIKVPTFDANSEAVKRLTDQLKSAYNDELVNQYVTRLENDIGYNINQAALAQAVGRSSNQSGF
jgi:peptidyl-prolyl cis-trans isomerase D